MPSWPRQTDNGLRHWRVVVCRTTSPTSAGSDGHSGSSARPSPHATPAACRSRRQAMTLRSKLAYPDVRALEPWQSSGINSIPLRPFYRCARICGENTSKMGSCRPPVGAGVVTSPRREASSGHYDYIGALGCILESRLTYIEQQHVRTVQGVMDRRALRLNSKYGTLRARKIPIILR